MRHGPEQAARCGLLAASPGAGIRPNHRLAQVGWAAGIPAMRGQVGGYARRGRTGAPVGLAGRRGNIQHVPGAAPEERAGTTSAACMSEYVRGWRAMATKAGHGSLRHCSDRALAGPSARSRHGREPAGAARLAVTGTRLCKRSCPHLHDTTPPPVA